MKNRMIQIAAVIMLLLGGISIWDLKSEAATYTESEIGTADDIGKYDDTVAGGYAHVGVKIYWEDKLVCYALDTWKRKQSYQSILDWDYLASNYNGKIHYFTESYSPVDSPIKIQKTGNRFVIDCEAIRNGKTEYSVILDKTSAGKSQGRGFEIANVPAGEYGTTSVTSSESFQPSKSELRISGNYAAACSFSYHIYDVRNIQPGAEIPANTGGGKLESPGKAYYNGSGYCLTKLPTASYIKSGYTTEFLGWYSAATGGKQYKEGDILQKGNTLYARWSMKANQYDVTCIDVLGKDESGTVLGRTSWKADCDAKVTGEKTGTDKTVGAYYENCYYTGATTATVTASGATVYRYFSYESYPVRYIDQIESGPRKGEMLHTSVEEKEYASNVTGADLGDNMQPGAYYKGYCYSNCTSANVTAQETIVYRYFRPVKYTVIFDGNGATKGTMEELTECQYDDIITLPRNIFQKTSKIKLYSSKEKLPEETTELVATHKFLGWATKPDGTVQYTDADFMKNITEQEESITLYAVWSEEKVVPPNVPSKMGYHFLGWAESPDAQNGMSQVTVTGSTELYAVWKQDVVKYHVEYYKENLNGEYELASNYEFEAYSDETVSLNSIDKIYPGFTLDEASSKLSGQVKADGSLILCAYFRRNAYEISYDLNGGSLSSENGSMGKEKVKFGKSMVLSSVLPNREGYLFQGWSQEADNDTVMYQPGDGFVMQNHDITLYAQWKPLTFTVKYDNNAAYSKISGISGTVPDTVYICQKDSYASEAVFQSTDAKMLSWNSKPDGSGISVLPGTNMKGLFDSCKELTLYAIWKQDNSNSATFQLTICKEITEQNTIHKKKIDTLTLQGRAGEKISTAILRIYQNELQGESAIYFYKGYEVVNTEDLEQIISLDSSTDIALTVKERKCTISYRFDTNEPDNQIPGVVTEYQEKMTLPGKLPNGDSIEGFEDSMGNHYEPGSSIILEHNLQLYVQHAIHLHDEASQEKEQIIYVIRGKDYVLPEQKKAGYRFLGWYSTTGEMIGNAGDTIKNITKRCDLYAKWSEPLTYHISYDFGNLDIKILENNVSYYQYSKETLLPNADQIAVPEGYHFEGWYYNDDIEQRLITSIGATEYGDKVLKPYLTKKAGQDADKDKTDDKINDSDSKEDNNQQGDNTGNNQNPDDTTLNADKTGANDNEDNIINREDNENKGLSQNQGKVTVGTIFWKGNLKYQVISVSAGKESVKVIGNRWKSSKLSIPSKITYEDITFSVTEIGKKAFYQSKYITKIILSKKITKIDNKAFSNMKKLKSVTLGKGVKQIGKQAFQKNLNLKKIVIKSTKISKVGAKAFYRIHSKAKFKIFKDKKKAYQKLLKASKLKKTVQINNL